ncbi:MAG: hypothetical protein K6V73_09255 [Firmicutes bacterium]|nr:hypothetical protein [Bacillota bacterium]
MRRVVHWYGLIAIWGIVGSAFSATILLRHGGVPTAVEVLMDVITALLLIATGRAAKTAGARPVGSGAVAGSIFGLLAGWPAFLAHITRAEMLQRLPGRSLPPDAVRMANSPAAHAAAWLTTIVVGVVAGIILGFLGGLLSKQPSSELDV